MTAYRTVQQMNLNSGGPVVGRLEALMRGTRADGAWAYRQTIGEWLLYNNIAGQNTYAIEWVRHNRA